MDGCCSAKADPPRADPFPAGAFVCPESAFFLESESLPMITATGLELRAGARILLSPVTLRVQPGDRIGLVGRNGAGKTTTLKVLAGEGQPYAGTVDRRSEVGYLPQDPRTGDLNVTARDRVLSARGLDTLLTEMQKLEVQLEENADEKLVRRYGALE